MCSPAKGAPPRAAAADDIISIPFDPPIGTTLTYRMSQNDSRNEQQAPVALNMRVTFARDGDGYIMTVVSDLPPGTPGGEIALLLQRPTSIRLNPDGEMIAMVDEDAYWASVDRMTALMPAPADAAERHVTTTVVARMRALPPDERLALITRGFAPIVALAGHELAAGDLPQPDDERDTLMGRVVMQSRIITEALDNDMARVTLVASVPVEQLSRATSAMLHDFSPAGAAAIAVHFTAFEDRQIYVVSRRTGLMESWVSTRTVTGEQNGVSQTVVQRRELSRAP
jgi:hypothetical protein